MYPFPDFNTVTDISAEINLQNLLDHTAIWLIDYFKDVLETLSANECNLLELLLKCVCDRSQLTHYKQKFDNSTELDANILF